MARETERDQSAQAVKNYLELFFRHKWLILASCIFFTIMGIILSYVLPPVYRAKAFLEVDFDPRDPLFKAMGISRIDPLRLPALIKLITSRSVLVETMQVLKAKGQIPEGISEMELLRMLHRGIRAQETGLTTVRVQGEFKDRVLAANATNAACTAFIEHFQNQRLEVAYEKVEFLKKRKEVFSQQFAEAEKKLEEFKYEHRELLPSEVSEEVSELLGQEALVSTEVLRYTQYQANLIVLNLQLKSLNKNREGLLERLNKESEYLPVEKLADRTLMQLQNELLAKKLALNKALTRYTEEYPYVKNLRSEIEQLERTLKEQIRLKAAGGAEGERFLLNPIYQDLKLQLSKLDSRIDEIKTSLRVAELYIKQHGKRVEEIPKKNLELEKLRAEYNIVSSQLKNADLKLADAIAALELESKGMGPRFWVAEAALIPSIPAKPRKDFLILGGFLFGLFVGLTTVYLIDITDQTFTDVEQLSAFLKIPVLGATSRIISPKQLTEIGRWRRLIFIWIVGSFMLLVILLFGVVKYLKR